MKIEWIERIIKGRIRESKTLVSQAMVSFNGKENKNHVKEWKRGGEREREECC